MSAAIVRLPDDVSRFHAGMHAVRSRAGALQVSSESLRRALCILLTEMRAGRSSGAAVALANSSMLPPRRVRVEGGAA